MTLGREDAPAPAPGRQGPGEGGLQGSKSVWGHGHKTTLSIVHQTGLESLVRRNSLVLRADKSIHCPRAPRSEGTRNPSDRCILHLSDNFPRQVHHVTNLGTWQERTTQPHKQGLGPLTATVAACQRPTHVGSSGAQKNSITELSP